MPSHCQPLCNRSYASRPKPSPFAKRPKATFIKRSNPDTRHNIEKLSKPRNDNVGYHPEFMQWNWLAIVKAKEAEVVEQVPTFTQPATTLVIPAASSAPVQPMKAFPTQSQRSPRYCAICTPN